MKRYYYLLIGVVLVLSIALPFHSTAGNLNIVTTDGFTKGIPYKSFLVDEAGNVTVMTDGTSADLGTVLSEPIITISGTGANNSTGVVNGTKDTPLSFNVLATDSSGTPSLSCLYPSDPPGVFSNGSFIKTYNASGTYYATFEASITEGVAPNQKTYITQRLVKIIITDPGAPQQYTLSVNISPSGAGSVSLDPFGGTYAAGTVVTLTYTVNAGYTFNSWTGVDSTYLNTATVTMNSNRTVTLNCNQSTPPPNTYTLTVNISPSGAGSVSLNPSGGSYTAGTVVTLTYTANAGYNFNSWTGVDSTYLNTATVTMNSNRTVTANFTQSGGGSGTYSQQVGSAVRLNQVTVGCSTCYGYYSGPGQASGQYDIPLGGTVWFLIDPKSVVGTVPSIRAQFTDFLQDDNLRQDNVNSVLIYTIDPSDNAYPGVTNPQRILLSGNTFGPWIPRGGHNDSKRYLIKVVEEGSRATPYNIYWWPY